MQMLLCQLKKKSPNSSPSCVAVSPDALLAWKVQQHRVKPVTAITDFVLLATCAFLVVLAALLCKVQLHLEAHPTAQDVDWQHP
jgi:hypothetical protein